MILTTFHTAMSLQYASTIALSFAAVWLLAQCKKTPSQSSDHTTLAVVAGQTLTAEDLVKEAEWRRAGNQPVPAPEILLEEMVNRLALVERARKSGIGSDPETKRRIESLLIAGLREKELDSELAKVVVTDKELAAAYEARREEFSRKALDRFAILFQSAHSKMSDDRRAESRARLESAISMAKANPATGGRGPAASGFGSVAADYSDDQASRYRGGDIGWVEAGAVTRLPAAVIDAGRALKKNTHSDIIDTEDGFYVIMKTDERPGGARPLEEISERLRKSLLDEKQLAIEKRFIAEALKLAKVEMNIDAARKVGLPAGSRPKNPSDEPAGFPGVPAPSAAR